MISSQFSKTLSAIYGRNFNPQRFERGSRRGRGLYFWAMVLLLGAIAAALAFVIYTFTRSASGFSGEKVELALAGNFNPPAAADTEYILNIANKEDIGLSDMEVFLGWPGSAPDALPRIEILTAGGEAATGGKNTWAIGALGKGESKQFDFSARFYGSAGDRVSLAVKVGFRPVGLNSVITREFEQEFILEKSKIEFSLDAPDSASAGSEIALSAALAPAITQNYPQVWLRLDYPDNFELTSEEPKEEEGGWTAANLVNVDDKLTLLVRGRLQGNAGEEADFSAILLDKKNGTALASASKKIKLQNVALDITLSAAPASGQKLQWGERLDYKATVKNSSIVKVEDLVVSVSVSGEELIRPGTIKPGNGGFFESGNVIWDKNTTSALADLAPGASVNLTFSLEILSEPPPRSGTPAILTKARLKGQFAQEDALAESGEVVTKILSSVSLESGLSAKSGPRPPLPGQTTVYTITWQIGPTSGTLRDLEIRAKLPPASGWADETDLQVGELNFDSESRTVIWRASRTPRLNEPVAVSFDVNVKPESEAANDFVVLEQTAFAAVDEAAGESMELINFPLTLGAAR